MKKREDKFEKEKLGVKQEAEMQFNCKLEEEK